MEVINDSTSHPMRFVLPDKTAGLYYNSRDASYHLCDYVPFTGGPKSYLCGRVGNYSPSRGLMSSKRKCPDCFNLLPENIYSLIEAASPRRKRLYEGTSPVSTPIPREPTFVTLEELGLPNKKDLIAKFFSTQCLVVAEAVATWMHSMDCSQDARELIFEAAKETPDPEVIKKYKVFFKCIHCFDGDRQVEVNNEWVDCPHCKNK